nr:MAG: Pectate lyase superfamily protein [Bacteriophage sp.]
MDLDNIQRKYGLPAPLPVVQNGKFAPRFPLNLEHRGDDVFQFGGKYIGEIENIYDLLYKILTNQEIDASLALPYAIKITEDKLYVRDKTNSEWITIFDITKPNFPKEIELYELIYKAITHQVIGEDTSYPGQFKIEENILYVRDKDNLTWTQIGDVTKEFLGATEATQAILERVNEILIEVQELKTELNRQIATTNETLTIALQAANEAMTSAQSINIRTFNSVKEMKASNTLKAGALAKTLGFYTAGDGGGTEYVITDNIDDDEADEICTISLQNDLYAKVILDVNRTINLKWFGVKGDNVTDDTEAIQKAVFYCRDYVIKNKCDNVVLFIPSGTYKITNTVRVPMHFMHIKGSKQVPMFEMEEKSNVPVIWFATTPDEVTQATEIGHTVKNLTVRSTALNINSHVENSIGVKFGGATMDDEKAMQIRFENFSILGFETAQLWLCNVYLLDFNNCGCGYQRYYVRCPNFSNNSGEKMSFRNSTLWFAKTFFYISQSNIQLMFHNVSFDGGYQVLLSDVINEAPGNTRYFYQCHFEPIAGGSDDYLIHIKNPAVLENVVLDGCTGYIPHIKTDYLVKTNTGGGSTSWKGTNIVIKNCSMILGDATPPSSGYLCDHYVRSENFVFSNQNDTAKKCLLSEYNNAFGNNKFSGSNIVENNTDDITNSRAIFFVNLWEGGWNTNIRNHYSNGNYKCSVDDGVPTESGKHLTFTALKNNNSQIYLALMIPAIKHGSNITWSLYIRGTNLNSNAPTIQIQNAYYIDTDRNAFSYFTRSAKLTTEWQKLYYAETGDPVPYNASYVGVLISISTNAFASSAGGTIEIALPDFQFC